MRMTIKVFVMDDECDNFLVTVGKAAVVIDDAAIRSAQKAAPGLLDGILDAALENYFEYLNEKAKVMA